MFDDIVRGKKDVDITPKTIITVRTGSNIQYHCPVCGFISNEYIEYKSITPPKIKKICLTCYINWLADKAPEIGELL
jgi:hypothetical protein